MLGGTTKAYFRHIVRVTSMQYDFFFFINIAIPKSAFAFCFGELYLQIALNLLKIH